MTEQPVCQRLASLIASLLVAMDNCRKSGNCEWLSIHTQHLQNLVKEHMPRGSGFDGTHLWTNDCTPDKLVFHTSFHHMDDHGLYDGWTDHTVIVRPSLAFGLDLKVTGKNRDNIKDLIAQAFDMALRKVVEI
jgi:hypothetical protein